MPESLFRHALVPLRHGKTQNRPHGWPYKTTLLTSLTHSPDLLAGKYVTQPDFGMKNPTHQNGRHFQRFRYQVSD